MRKIISAILSLALLVSLAACSAEPEVTITTESTPTSTTSGERLSYLEQKDQEVTPALKKTLEEQVIKSRKDIPWEKGSSQEAIYFETRNSVTRMVDFENYNINLLNGKTLTFKVDQELHDIFSIDVGDNGIATLGYGKDQPDLTRDDYVIQVPTAIPDSATPYRDADGFYELKDGDSTRVFYKTKDGLTMELQESMLFNKFTADMLNERIKPFLDEFKIVDGTETAIKWFILPEAAIDLTDKDITGYGFESSGFFKLRVGDQNTTQSFTGIGEAKYKFSNLKVNDINFKSIKIAERQDIDSDSNLVLVSESGIALLNLPYFDISDLRREIPTYAKLGDIVWAKE